MGYKFKREDAESFAMHLHADTKEHGGELFFKYCPYCDGGGKDKQTFSINLDGGMFHCFRAGCGKSGHFVELARDFDYALEFEDKPHKKRYKKLQQVKIETREPAIAFLESRGISRATAEKYSITTQKDKPNILVFPFFDENGVMVAAKYRKTDFNKDRDKNKEWFEKDTKPILFGMLQCSDFSKPLIITEGQLDSLSVAESGIPNAVSVPNGCTARTWQPLCYEWVEKFPEIIIFGDNDEAGRTMIEHIESAFTSKKIRVVRPMDYLGEKDANDILRKFGKDAIVKAVQNAQVKEVDAVKPLASVKAVDLTSMPKILTGIHDIDRVIGGMYLGHLIILTGKRGEGKSTLSSNIVANAIEQGHGVFIYSGELPDYHFKNWLDLQIAGKEHIEMRPNRYKDYDYYLTDQTVQVINNWYADKAYIFDNTAVYAQEGSENIKLLEVIEQAVCRYGLTFVLIDNLMTAMDTDSENFYLAQGTFMKSLKRLALKLNIAILLVAHPRKENGEIGNDSVSGTSVITDIADLVLTYSANTGDDKLTYQSVIGLTKNRLGNGKKLSGNNRLKVRYSEISKRIGGDSDDLNKEYSCFAVAADYTAEEPPF